MDKALHKYVALKKGRKMHTINSLDKMQVCFPATWTIVQVMYYSMITCPWSFSGKYRGSLAT